MILFNRSLNIELINGCGIFLEFSDSRPVWCCNRDTEETYTMPFEGVLLMLPFVLISYGRVYEEIE
jgi:hypothetical protein